MQADPAAPPSAGVAPDGMGRTAVGDQGIGDDAAWVVIDTPLSPGELRLFLDDVERLFRINPHYVFERFEPLGGGRYRLALHNMSNDRDVDVEITARWRQDSLDVRYGAGLKTATLFRAEPGAEGRSRLVVTDTYAGLPEAERLHRLDEVDRSLTAWGRALHGYIRLWSRWHWLAPFRWYMARVWLPMKPSARRIVFLFLAISAFDLLALGALGLLLMLSRLWPSTL